MERIIEKDNLYLMVVSKNEMPEFCASRTGKTDVEKLLIQINENYLDKVKPSQFQAATVKYALEKKLGKEQAKEIIEDIKNLRIQICDAFDELEGID